MGFNSSIKFVRKRNGVLVEFAPDKVVEAIFMAAQSVGGKDRVVAEKTASKVISYLDIVYKDGNYPTVEIVQDMVEKILIEQGHAKLEKA